MRRVKLWGPLFFWCALIFFLSGIPDLNSGLEYDYPLRKLCHMIEFGALFWLTRRALAGTWGERRAWLFAAAAFAVFYAMTDEYHQTFVIGRHGCWSDVGIDSAGVFAAVLIRVLAAS